MANKDFPLIDLLASNRLS